jgi:hypothetical protein
MSKLAYRAALGLAGLALCLLVELASATAQDFELVEPQPVREIGRGEFFKPSNWVAVGGAQPLPGRPFSLASPLSDLIVIRFNF